MKLRRRALSFFASLYTWGILATTLLHGSVGTWIMYFSFTFTLSSQDVMGIKRCWDVQTQRLRIRRFRKDCIRMQCVCCSYPAYFLLWHLSNLCEIGENESIHEQALLCEVQRGGTYERQSSKCLSKGSNHAGYSSTLTSPNLTLVRRCRGVPTLHEPFLTVNIYPGAYYAIRYYLITSGSVIN